MVEYNDVYYKPAKEKFDELNAKGLLDNTKFFDEKMEVEFYELWHHEGCRARKGDALISNISEPHGVKTDTVMRVLVTIAPAI